jgi:hypothetical protein
MVNNNYSSGSRLVVVRRRSKLYRVLRLAIRQFLYALKAYNKFSSIIASDMRRTKESVISIYKTITFDPIMTDDDEESDNESVSVLFAETPDRHASQKPLLLLQVEYSRNSPKCAIFFRQ